MSDPTPHNLSDREGQTVPDVSFKVRRGADWATLTSDEIFKGKNVIVFSLPGAFTPTCSATHLLRCNQLASVFRQQGIDQIACISVNDPFVMEAWGKEKEAQSVLLLPDGNGAFTRGMGLLVDKSDLNFGQRSWRYSMLVRDRKIEKMFIEPDEPGDPFKASDADTLLAYLDPKAREPDQLALLSSEGCAFCAQAKKALDTAGIDYVDVPLPHTVRSTALGAIAGAQTVPQLFANGQRVGGSAEIDRWLEERKSA
ncbi:MAG: glutathione peroxidase [Burkholderiaceae bacterium]